MIIVVYLPIAAAWLIGSALGSDGLLRRCWRSVRGSRQTLPHPELATWAITISCVVCSLLSTWSLVLLATARIDRVSFITERMHLSGSWLRTNHVPFGVAAIAATYLGVRAARLLNTLRTIATEQHRWRPVVADACGGLVVLDEPTPMIFAVGGRPGMIVASRGLLRLLDHQERKAVLSHEQAHIDRRHWLHRSVVELAIGAEPFLRPARRAIHLQTERVADEAAAKAVGDRRPVLSGLRRVRQARISGDNPVPVLPTPVLRFHGDTDMVELRLDALSQSPVPLRLRILGPYAAVVVAATWASADATGQLLHLLAPALN